MPGIAVAIAIAVSSWCASKDIALRPCLAFHDRVDVAGARIDADLFAPPLRSASLDAEALNALGGDLARAFDVAAGAAGAFSGTRRVRVDGFASAVQPAGTAAAGVTVRADPFSVEYGGLDRIELAVDLLPPSRKWQFNATPPVWRGGALDPLSNRAPATRRIGGAVAGPGPARQLTFFAQGDRLSQDDRRAFARADGAVAGDEDAVTRMRLVSGAAGLAWSGRASLVRASVFSSHTNVANAGIGALVTPAAAFTLDSNATQAQVVWDLSRPVRQRGGLVVRYSRVASRADTQEAAEVSAALVVGGPELPSRVTSESGWTFRHVAQASDARWLAGLELSHEQIAETRSYNPEGTRRFTIDGLQSHTVTDTDGPLQWLGRSAALFAHRIVRLGPAAALRAGVRADWSSAGGVFLSPRVSLGARAAGVLLSGAAAFSAEEWNTAALGELAWRERGLVRPRVDGRALRLDVDPGFRRRRDRIVRLGAARQIGPVLGAVEHTWTSGSSLAGAARVAREAALIDTVAADRRLGRTQTHVSARTRVGPLGFVAHYEWVRSRDNTDGWLSLPATGDISQEWGPSTGLARHHASVVVTGRIWRAAQIIAVVHAASGRPYSVSSGRDPDGLAAFSDRGGFARNSHETPGWSTVDLYLSRTFRLPRLNGAAVDVGVRAENLFDALRVEEVGRVLGTPLFGRPLSAGPGRSISLWAAIARR